jgi:hypothetical protein
MWLYNFSTTDKFQSIQWFSTFTGLRKKKSKKFSLHISFNAKPVVLIEGNFPNFPVNFFNPLQIEEF